MTGPRIGSRPWKLSQLAPGESLLLEAPPGRGTAFMQQVGVDCRRAGGGFSQALILGVDPDRRVVVDIIRVTKCVNQQP
jgi:hypothetical protein